MELEQGVTKAEEAFGGKAWDVVGHTYTPKLLSDDAFVWHAIIPAETFVPPHIHPYQDEWICVLDGRLEVEFGAETHAAGPGIDSAGVCTHL